MSKLKVLFICGGNFHALIPVNHVLERCNVETPAVLVSNQLMRKKSNLQAARFILKKSGLRYFCFKLLENYLLKLAVILLGKKSRLKLISRMTQEKRIKIVKFRSADDQDFLRQVKLIKPDVIITLIFQKIPEAVIAQAGIGCINLHPGILPEYRVHGGNFWPLFNGDSHFGYTIHYLDGNLDTGDILKIERFPISDNDTVQTLLFKQQTFGANGLVEIINKISSNEQLSAIKQRQLGEGKSWPWPSAEDVANLIFIKRRRLFRLRDIFRCVQYKF